jgi:hypothetical protein
MRAVVAKVSLIYPVSSASVSLSHHVELALYVDDTLIIATSRKPTLFVCFLESYLSDFQPWLIEWRIAINVSKNTAVIFAPTSNTLRGTKPVVRHNSLCGVDPRYTTELVASHLLVLIENHSKHRYAGSPLNRNVDPSLRNGVLLYMQLIRPTMG